MFLLKQQLNFGGWGWGANEGKFSKFSHHWLQKEWHWNGLFHRFSTLYEQHTSSPLVKSSSLQESYYWWLVMGNEHPPRLLESSKCHKCQEKAKKEGEEAVKQLLSSLLCTNHSTSLSSGYNLGSPCFRRNGGFPIDLMKNIPGGLCLYVTKMQKGTCPS